MTEYAPLVVADDAAGERGVPRTTVYVYEAPVRFWHWLNAACIMTLMITGYFIGAPLPTTTGDANDRFLMGYIRLAHFIAGQTMALAFLGRMFWTFAGNVYARQLFIVPFWTRNFWLGVWYTIAWYLFLVPQPKKYIGHNPLAMLTMYFTFVIPSLIIILTGSALYSEATGRDSVQAYLFGWMFYFFPNSQEMRTLHHLSMWVLVVFIMVHLYMSLREDIVSRQTMISAITTGHRSFRDDD